MPAESLDGDTEVFNRQNGAPGNVHAAPLFAEPPTFDGASTTAISGLPVISSPGPVDIRTALSTAGLPTSDGASEAAASGEPVLSRSTPATPASKGWLPSESSDRSDSIHSFTMMSSDNKVMNIAAPTSTRVSRPRTNSEDLFHVHD